MSTNGDQTLSDSDLKQNVALLMRMLAIPGKSGEEGEIIRFIVGQLRKAGVPASAIKTDRAHQHSPIGGQVGNLIVKLPGSGGMARRPRRMFTAHVDTVPICIGCKPGQRGSRIVNGQAKTGLGADNRSGAAVVLTTTLHLVRRKLPHPPLTFFWPVQEEVGLHGVRHVGVTSLGNPKLSFNFDGGSSAKLTIGATGAYRMAIEIDGIASHAGVQPQEGVSAITIAGLAIADLERGGWLGSIHKRGPKGGRGTSNIGYVNAGGATNVVTNHAVLKAEVRSHDTRFRKHLLDLFRKAFQDAAKRVQNVAGRSGQVRIEHDLDYEAFVLKQSEPAVAAAAAAVTAVGGKPVYSIVDGGLDANWLCVHGIPTVTFGVGQKNPHTVDEALDLHEFNQACRITLYLATGVDDA